MIEKRIITNFKNITPATFQNSYTYLQQLRVLKDKVNEIIDVLNSLEVQSGESESNDWERKFSWLF